MMNPLTCWNRLRWKQLNEQEDLQHSLRSLSSRSPFQWPEKQPRAAQWIPLVDVSEDEAGYVLRVELPRVKHEDVKITVEDGTLTITGDRKFEQNGRKDHDVEHTHGRFAHSFAIPVEARPAQVSSVFKNGVLTLHVAKRHQGTPSQMQAETAAYDPIPNLDYYSSGWGINE